MTERGTDFMPRLLAWMVVERRSPNEALTVLLSEFPDVNAEDVLLDLLETALRLEEMYDEVCQDEWNDWLRVDQWKRMAGRGEPTRGGSMN